MNNSDPIAKYGHAVTDHLTSMLQARGVSIDGPVATLFLHAGELSARNIENPGELTLPVLIFAVSDIARDLLGHEGTADFKLIADVLDPRPEESRSVREQLFFNHSSNSHALPRAPLISSIVEGLLVEASRLVRPFGVVTLNHIIAAIPSLPVAALDNVIVDFGINPQRVTRLIEMQNGRVQLEGAEEFEASLKAEVQSGNTISSEIDVGDLLFQDTAEAEIQTAKETSPASPPMRREEVQTDLSLDDPEVDEDAFGRTVLAIGLARRLHRIWCQANRIEYHSASDPKAAEAPPAALLQRIRSAVPKLSLRVRTWSMNRRNAAEHDSSRSSFVLHIDAPWGGGKTTFAHFIASTLNPAPCGQGPAKFLRQRYGDSDLRGIFLEDPPKTDAERDRASKQEDAARRPWIIVNFNAWQTEHCQPPWWVFYQTIRQQSFMAIRKQGTKSWSPASQGSDKQSAIRTSICHYSYWLMLWSRELWFRMTTPRIRALFVTGLISLFIFMLLQFTGAWGVEQDEKGASSAAFQLKNPIGLLLAGMTGVSFLWAAGKVLTEAFTPGIDLLAEGIGMGKTDPFDRFKRHFQSTLRTLRRPVMVVIDDLDRCNPAFVVDLMRGIQTLLRSPRVTYLILGDREWIETAFEVHYSPMQGVEVGPEQSLGARFVEKAIQMSFILPAASDQDRSTYLRGVLLGPNKTKRKEMSAAEAAKVRMITTELSSQDGLTALDSTGIADKVIASLSPDNPIETELRAQVEQEVNDTLAINATVDRRVDEEIFHQLEALADCFPPNPRQVKRIVNAVTLYYAAAVQRPGLAPDAEFRRELTIWIILMNEWPETWKLLVSCPALVDVLRADDRRAAVEQIDPILRPGAVDATVSAIDRIAAYPALLALIIGDKTGRRGLSVQRVRIFAELTPLHRRQRQLDDGRKAVEN